MGKMQSVSKADACDLSGKVIIVTGGNAGLGKATIIAFAKMRPQKIYLAARNEQKSLASIDEIQRIVPNTPISFLQCDLASLESVQQAAHRFLSISDRLDILVCNAGVMAVPAAVTKDGFEVQFGTNHLGHSLLIKLLSPTLQQTSSDPRVILITSKAMGLAPKEGIAFSKLRTSQADSWRWSLYGQSKLANILHAAELAQRVPKITAVSIHPGTVMTDVVGTMGFWDRMFVRLGAMGRLESPEEGVRNTVWAATTSKSNIVNGEYYEPVGVRGSHTKRSNDKDLARRLWEWTEDALKGYEV